MNNIKDALTRKFGPLPAWAWAIIGGIAVYWYRNHGVLSAAATSTTTGGSVVPVAATPQPITTLGPGESAYDPNTGQLLTTPGGDTTGTSTDSINRFADALDSLANAIADGVSAGESTTAGGAPAPISKPTKPTTHRKPKPKKGHKKVKVGSGRGRGKATHHPTTRGKSQTTTHRPTTRGHKTTSGLTAGKRTTGRIRAKLTRAVVTQRPVATHQPAQQEVHPAPQRAVPTRTAPRPTPARHTSVAPPKPAPRPAPKPAPKPVARKR